MRILHTEASGGLGGQELRILKEAEGMRRRGHEVLLAVVEGGQLVPRARELGFQVYELALQHQYQALKAGYTLARIIRQHQIDLVNTHSSWDAWVAGITARLTRCPVMRTRHLSTPTRQGVNSHLLYRSLADVVVTTCQETAQTLQAIAGLSKERCRSIPTGVNREELAVSEQDVQTFRADQGIRPGEVVIGTACILRSWKGVTTLIDAAKQLENMPHLRWLIVGDGPSRQVLEHYAVKLGIRERFLFTGYLRRPEVAIAAMDVFALLSTANEGVSQATLQAAYLKRPLITTSVGGLAEVCVDGSTGFLVPIYCSKSVAERICQLAGDPTLRETLGQQGHRRVLNHFTIEHTLDAMEEVYRFLLRSQSFKYL